MTELLLAGLADWPFSVWDAESCTVDSRRARYSINSPWARIFNIQTNRVKGVCTFMWFTKLQKRISMLISSHYVLSISDLWSLWVLSFFKKCQYEWKRKVLSKWFCDIKNFIVQQQNYKLNTWCHIKHLNPINRSKSNFKRKKILQNNYHKA